MTCITVAYLSDLKRPVTVQLLLKAIKWMGYSQLKHDSHKSQRPEMSHYRPKSQWKVNKMPLGLSKLLSWITEIKKLERNRHDTGVCFSASAKKNSCSIHIVAILLRLSICWASKGQSPRLEPQTCLWLSPLKAPPLVLGRQIFTSCFWLRHLTMAHVWGPPLYLCSLWWCLGMGTALKDLVH